LPKQSEGARRARVQFERREMLKARASGKGDSNPNPIQNFSASVKTVYITNDSQINLVSFKFINFPFFIKLGQYWYFSCNFESTHGT
jgi:hypothetical protein